MTKFIVLLRGINVSGQKKIKMSDLKSLFEDLNFTNVQTYIQSGNVIFESKTDDLKSLVGKIEKKIKEKFSFDVKVILKTFAELEYILNNNLFLKKQKANSDFAYVTFLSEEPSTISIKKLKEINYNPEEYFIVSKTIYVFLPNGYGRAKLNNNFFESKLKVMATTRNWKTVNKLYELSKSNSL
ncbi:MAG: hypothetical protein A2W30_04350 [Ignavibacteria bacterium RBG_16_36_9]|nr:MAG: hypothetical protein A2W30_04350 [Ignavibacteria bacterium RBG_16_36_9]